jgi:preprotein translocase subunit YajC
LRGTIVYAQEKSGAAPGKAAPMDSYFFVPFLIIIAIFYFLMIRPQQKKEKQRKKMIDGLQKGDKVLTAGGIYGEVTGIKPEQNSIVLKIAENTRVEFSRSAIQTKINKKSETKSNDKKN